MNIQKEALILFLKRILVVILFYQISRFLFYFFNQDLLDPITFYEFLGGFRFDLSIIGYLNLVFILLFLIPAPFTDSKKYKRNVFIAFYLVNFFVISMNFIDFEYFRFTSRRSTFSLITASGMHNEILNLLPAYMTKYWYIPIVYVVSGIAFWKLLPKYKSTKKTKFNIPSLIVLILMLGLFFVFGRGGIQAKPLRIVDANQYSITANTAFVLNTPFCVMKTMDSKEELVQYDYYSEEELNKIFNPIKDFKGRVKTDKNLVLIILESFGKDNINIGYTPFLDSLTTHSLNFENSYANGKLSIDAVPSIVSGIPSLMNLSYISSSYAVNEIKSLPKILNENGYHTSFFHGAFNGSQNFEQFANIAGYQDYYGKSQYKGPEAFDGTWGIFDEEFLQYTAKEINTFKQPFFSTIFTISSHAPFTIPKKYKDKFPKGTTEIHESIAYSDFALRKFFQTASKMPWYENTFFILLADHTSGSKKPREFNNTMGRFKVPILFFEPKNDSLKGKNYKNIQQADMFPSILDILGINAKFMSYGKSYLDEQDYVVNYIDNNYNYISGDYYLVFDGKKSIALYNLKNDPYHENNIITQENEKRLEMEKFIKAYIQSFNYRMTSNKLLVE